MSVPIQRPLFWQRGSRAAKTVVWRPRGERAAMLYDSRLENEATSAMCSRWHDGIPPVERWVVPGLFIRRNSSETLSRLSIARLRILSAIACNDRWLIVICRHQQHNRKIDFWWEASFFFKEDYCRHDSIAELTCLFWQRQNKNRFIFYCRLIICLLKCEYCSYWIVTFVKTWLDLLFDFLNLFYVSKSSFISALRGISECRKLLFIRFYN